MGEPTPRSKGTFLTLWLPWAFILAVLGSFPGFGGPSYAYGLIASVLVGPWGSAWAAYRVKALGLRGVDALFFGLRSGFSFLLALVLVALVHGLRLGFCDFQGDMTRLLLGAGIGALVACVWGVLVAQWVRPTWLCCLFAVVFPLGSYGLSFARFYTSPMVFAFDHFAGYFAGTLYDTELGSLDRLWSYRVGTAGLLTLMGSLVSLTRVPLLLWWTRRGTALLGLAGLAVCLGIHWHGPQLGHYQTSASITNTLGGELASKRCDVVFDASIGKDAAWLLGRECDQHIHELEHDLDVVGPARVRVFLFASADQKALLMGARHVYVAKPWREEVYINASGFPHPVLRHELAHVVAGVFGSGPFRVAGNASGLIPDPGRIEGIAVFAAPPEDETLTLAQWSSAMRRLDLMPPLDGLFQLGFFGSNSSSAYTVAGAFLEWVAERYGITTVKAWYAGGSLEDLTQSSFSDLERSFGAFLDQIAVSDRELAVARSRFERPAVLHRRCPHQVDGTLTLGLQWLARGDCNKAAEAFDQVLDMDASALRAEFGRAECAQRSNDAERALTLFREVAASPFAGTDFKTAAFERAGDVAWQQQEFELADQLYLEAQAVTVDDDNLRQLDIKRAALASGREGERVAVEGFFFGPNHKGPFPLYIGNLLGEWVTRQPRGLPQYLLGKQYLATNQWQLAKDHLEHALRGELQPRVRREALRSLLVASCALDDRAGAARAWEELTMDPLLTTAQHAGLRALARRCGAIIR